LKASTPTDEAGRHARALVEVGVSVNDISRISGLHKRTIRGILSGQRQFAYRESVQAILGIPIPESPHSSGCSGYIDATAARRRLQALATRGFPLLAVARESGVKQATITAIRSGRQGTVSLEIDSEISEVYRLLWKADPKKFGVPEGDSSRAMSWAASQEWAPPAAWDDETIRDPKAKPRGHKLPTGRMVYSEIK
jgi:transcriptional regulator with XRE-family HTH domain